MRGKDWTGVKLHRLTFISPTSMRGQEGSVLWEASCDCGKTAYVIPYAVSKGRVKSCGCFRNEAFKGKDPRIASALVRWRQTYSDCSFDTFYRLSQLSCYYCGASPSQKAWVYKSKNRDVTEDERFIYNGLDRIDPFMGHTDDNVVSCCANCNFAKNNLNLNEFLDLIEKIYKRIKNIKANGLNPNLDLKNLTPIPISDQPENHKRKYHPIVSSAKHIWRNDYKDCDFNIFFHLSQLSCYYCGSAPSRSRNAAFASSNYGEYQIKNGNFVCNGLDRIDNSRGHVSDNLVPCCFSCNKMKLNHSLEEFLDIVEKIYNHTRLLR